MTDLHFRAGADAGRDVPFAARIRPLDIAALRARAQRHNIGREARSQKQFINHDGDLRTHPAMTIGGEPGLDGFFAARLVHR